MYFKETEIPPGTDRVFDVKFAVTGKSGSKKFAYVMEIYEGEEMIFRKEDYFLDSNLVRTNLHVIAESLLFCIASLKNPYQAESLFVRVHYNSRLSVKPFLTDSIKHWTVGAFYGRLMTRYKAARNQDIWFLLLKLAGFVNMTLVETDVNNSDWYKILRNEARKLFKEKFLTGASLEKLNLKSNRLENIYSRRPVEYQKKRLAAKAKSEDLKNKIEEMKNKHE